MTTKRQLTEEGVAKIKTPGTIFDTIMPGLMLRVGDSGRKTWLARHYKKGRTPDGKAKTIPTTHKLGVFPILTVKMAREAARLFLVDPTAALDRADNVSSKDGSFGAVADTFVARYVKRQQLRTEVEVIRCIDKYLRPYWQERPFAEIKRSDVRQLFDRIEDEHGAVQADRVLAIVRKMMRYHATRNDDYSPVIISGMQRARSAKERARTRVLSDSEIRTLWQQHDVIGSMLKVLLLTGQRKAKVERMKWSDIVEDEWRIASEPREKTNAGTLRLPSLVLDIIEAQPRVHGCPYVFAGRGLGSIRLDTTSRFPFQLDSPWVVHDLRRTARSLLSRAGVQPHIAEQVLGHSIKGVQGTYDRHPYDDEKAEALEKLGGLVERIVSNEDNVVALRR